MSVTQKTDMKGTMKWCSFEGCSQQAVLSNRQSVFLGRDERNQCFVFRVYHSCSRHALYYARSDGEMLYQQEKLRGLQRMFFLVTPQHLALAKRLYITWYDAENGAPGANCFRPYGNSSVIADIAHAIGYRQCSDEEEYSRDEEQYLEGLHREMHLVLQIILHTGQMKPGIYHKPRLSEEWVFVEYPEGEPELVFAQSKNDVPSPQADLRRVLVELVRQLREEDFSDREIRRFVERTSREAMRDMGMLSGDEEIPPSLFWPIATLLNDVL